MMINYDDKPDKGLKIITLGNFNVWDQEGSLTDQYSSSLKLWELFKYFITYRDELLIPENIIEAIWPEADYQDPKRTLRALIFRLRKILGEGTNKDSNSIIAYGHGCYKFNSQGFCCIDIIEFEETFNQAYDLAKDNPKKAIELYNKAINLYKNQYLSECHAYEWLVPTRNYYQRIFFRSIYELTDLLKENKQHREIIKICQKALKYEFFEEGIHIRYLEALVANGKSKQARDHYYYLVEMFERELKIKPSGELTAAYQALFMDRTQKNHKIISISECYKGNNLVDGPIVCQLDVFKFQCQLEQRRSGRYGKDTYVGLMTLSLKDYTLLANHNLKYGMEKLKEILISGLRKGDMIAQWSEAQFVVNLPGPNIHHARRALERIEKLFASLNDLQELALDIKVETLPALDKKNKEELQRQKAYF